MKKMILLILILVAGFAKAKQKVIQLYNGAAPGSENWNWQEKESSNNAFHEKLVYNVTQPSLTVFLPDSAVNNGTAVVICPGGAFQILSIESEGNEVAGWLAKKGVTAFVLRYRLMHSLTDDPVKELFAKQPGSPKFNEEAKPVIDMAIADGEKALTYVREHAPEYGLAPNRIGIIGFSAGGTISTALAYNYTPADKPDFVGSIYPYIGSFPRTTIQKDAPPVFIAVAADDYFGFDKSCADFYKEWVNAKHSAELHIYAKGGHGFGMKKQNLPSDSWIERFGDWLKMQGLLDKH